LGITRTGDANKACIEGSRYYLLNQELNLSEELRELGLNVVVEKYKLLCKVHSKYDHVYLLKYDQVKSNFKVR
jgi:hypothetical protein